jgi:CHAT domain-containing protein
MPSPGLLQELPATKKEVLNAAAEVRRPATLLFGEDATETHFKRLPLQEFDILHLALHSYADPAAPDRSALIFAPEPHGPDDGL